MRRSRSQPDVVRRRRLAAIHAEAKALDLEDVTYRDLLERITGKRSAAKCTLDELSAVVAELHRLAGKSERTAMAAREWAGKPKVMTPLLQKVEALLTDAGREWAYAHGLAKRMFRVTRLEWLNDDQLHRLVAALQIDADRRRRKVT